MPLSCPVALKSQRELHKGGGSDIPAAPSAASCAASFTCSSFTCRPRKAWGECFCASVLRGAQHVLRHVLRYVLRYVLRRVLRALVLQVSPKGKRGGQNACVGRGFEGCLGRGPDYVRGRVAASRSVTPFCPLKGCACFLTVVRRCATTRAVRLCISASMAFGTRCSDSASRADVALSSNSTLGGVGWGQLRAGHGCEHLEEKVWWWWWWRRRQRWWWCVVGSLLFPPL